MRRILKWIKRQWRAYEDSAAFYIAELYGGPDIVDILYLPEEGSNDDRETS